MRYTVLFGLVFLAATLKASGGDGSVGAIPPTCVSGTDTAVILLHNPHDVDRLPNGNTLITDGGYPITGNDSRVLEVDLAGNLVWSYTGDLNFAHSAQRLPNGNTLISDTGNDRVIEVDPDGIVEWNTDAITLTDFSHLSYPNDADWLETDDHVLITDRDNHRAFEIDRAGQVWWQFGVTGVPTNSLIGLDGPHNADRLTGGNTIIADSQNNRILEVSPLGAIEWVYGPGGDDHLAWPRDADRLDNGNTLIADTERMRLLEVSHSHDVVWQYGDLDRPYDGDRLPNGHTLISKASRERVIELDETGAIVWSYPPGLVDIDLPSASTGSPTGAIAVRIDAPAPGAARYPDGAPVVIWVPGGFECGDLAYKLPTQAADLIVLTWLFPGCTDTATGRHSDGAYDYRGLDTMLALVDVIRYAAGQLVDSQGRTIDQVVPVPVVHNNIGMIGTSNGGNLIVAAPARWGSGLSGYLRYAIQWETPVSSQIATRDLGRVWLKPSGAQGDYFNDLYLGYDPLIFPMDFISLTFNVTETWYQVFHDGSGDGTYTTEPNEQEPYDPDHPYDPDLIKDGYLDPYTEDFPYDTYSDTQKLVYSRAVARALYERAVFSGTWPANIATVTETNLYWDIREAVRLYDEALANVPDLEGMVLASVRDHVQSMAGKPHIRQAFEGWASLGAWIQINPSRAYMLEVDPTLDPLALPENRPNEPPDWEDPDGYCMPERILGYGDLDDSIYQLAAIWQMADRARGWRVYLPVLMRGESGSPPQTSARQRL